MKVACLACGPSLAAAEVDRLQDRVKVLAIKEAWTLAPWADWMFAADPTWWSLAHKGGACRRDFPGQKWTHGKAAPWNRDLNVAPSSRHAAHKGGIVASNNSGLMAIHLAQLFGATRVLLLGYDMRKVDGRAHFHGDHAPPLRNESPYFKFVNAFKAAAPRLRAAGVDVVNCTAGSALTCFRSASLEEALCEP